MMNRRLPFLMAIALFGLTATGCGEGRAEKAGNVQDGVAVPKPRLRVKAEVAREGTLSLDSLRTGTTQAGHRMQLVAKIGGTLNRRLVNRGDSVRSNQLLFDIDDRMPAIDLRRAAAGLSGAESDLKQATRSYERAKRLLKSKGISQQAFESAEYGYEKAQTGYELAKLQHEAAQTRLEDTKVRAPRTAEVAMVMSEAGSVVGPGSPLALLVDLSNVVVGLSVSASELRFIDVGSEATGTFPDIGGESIAGKVIGISPTPDPVTGAYTVDVQFSNPDGRIREAMVAHVRLNLRASTGVVLVKREALLRHEGKTAVFVVKGEDIPTAHLTLVETGKLGSTQIEITKGLRPGDKVIVSGQFSLNEASPLLVEMYEGGNDARNR